MMHLECPTVFGGNDDGRKREGVAQTVADGRLTKATGLNKPSNQSVITAQFPLFFLFVFRRNQPTISTFKFDTTRFALLT
ncbi:hypothetical protein CBS63078_6172 [Aspergillus niger]|nr:hypothetical protein CBS115989_8075 [Aspergillus niger]KAI2821359.1 hypothetical protein CBS133816_9580 [Aspergillus niger]KAI2839272.1 hypothetical protein CBS11232_9410 [Aspergillus niger]KAI2847587.1 hypothetical protein CBS11350_3113 [Aspergillus niger]KAI2848140.1 hypothetical protein CBS12448_9171 [Aspergillus niger]